MTAYAHIIGFLVMQHFRTPALRDETSEMLKQLLAFEAEIETGRPATYLDDVDLKISHWADSVVHAFVATPLALDLDVKLIISEASAGFVTSDNPVILSNPFLDARGRSNGQGLACLGLQIFCPIDPCHVIIAYDRTTYRVGSPTSQCVRIHGKRDVRRLNELQLLNANATLFLPPTCDEASTRSWVAQLLPKRLPARPSVRQFLKVPGRHLYVDRKERPLPEKGSALLITSSARRHPSPTLSFIEVLPEARRRRLDNGLAHLRSQPLCDIYSTFWETREADLRNGRITPAEYLLDAIAHLEKELS